MTALILTGLSPACRAAKIAGQDRSRSPRLVICLNLSGSRVSRLTLIRRNPAARKRGGAFLQKRAVGRKAEVFQTGKR